MTDTRFSAANAGPSDYHRGYCEGVADQQEYARRQVSQQTPIAEDWSCAADFLDDIEVDGRGLCRWSDVANAQTHIRHSLRAAMRAPAQRQPHPTVTDEMLNAHIKALGNWAEPFTAERESGVAVDMDISQEDADFFNEEERKRLRIGYAAAFTSTSRETPCSHEAIIGLDGTWHCQRCGDAIDMAVAHTQHDGKSP